MNDSTPVRGPSVWLGCDAFGVEVVSRLGQRISFIGHDVAVHRSTKLVLRSPCPPNIDAALCLSVNDDTTLATTTLRAIGSLLAEVRFTTIHQEELRVPDLWALFDIADSDADRSIDEIVQILTELDARAIPARLRLILRDVTWDRTATDRDTVRSRVNRLLTFLVVPGTPGFGRIQIFVASDFGALLNRYSAADLTDASGSFAEWVVTTDATNSRHPNAIGALTPAVPAEVVDGKSLNVDRVFATFGAMAFLFPFKDIMAEANARRLRSLAVAFRKIPPDPWAPPIPPIPRRVEVSGPGTLQPLRLPRWRPRYGGSPESTFARYDRVLEDWLSNAETWRRHELTACFERRDALLTESDRAHEDYEDGLATGIRLILRDDSIPGLFAPLRQYFSRCQSDLQIREHTLGPGPSAAPVSSNDHLIEAIPTPSPIVDWARQEIATLVRQRANPLTVAVVAIVSAFIAGGWLFAIADQFSQSGLQSLAAWLSPPTSIPRSEIARWASTVRDWEMTDPAATVFWIVAVVILSTAVVLVSIFLRERRKQERVFDACYRQIGRWKARAASSISDTLSALQDWRYRENLIQDQQAVATWDERLSVAETRLTLESGRIPRQSGAFQTDLHITAPEDLLESQVTAVVMQTRAALVENRHLIESPSALEAIVLDAASRIAGDREPDLQVVLPGLMQQIRNGKPGEKGLLSRPVTTGESHQHWAFYGFFGAPARVAPALAREFRQDEVLKTPEQDRILAVSVRTGLNADEIFR